MDMSAIDTPIRAVSPILRIISGHDQGQITHLGLVAMCGAEEHLADTLPPETRGAIIEGDAIVILIEQAERQREGHGGLIVMVSGENADFDRSELLQGQIDG